MVGAVVRFEQKVMPEPNTGCWLWTDTLRNGGYGRLWVDGHYKTAHRFSYELFNGEIPAGLLVCHSCDVRSCVNPQHLFLGTYMDNSIDMRAKGRDKFECGGLSLGGAKLSESQVKAIRVASGTHADIAVRFGISRSAVSQIKSRQTWNFVK